MAHFVFIKLSAFISQLPRYNHNIEITLDLFLRVNFLMQFIHSNDFFDYVKNVFYCHEYCSVLFKLFIKSIGSANNIS